MFLISAFSAIADEFEKLADNHWVSVDIEKKDWPSVKNTKQAFGDIYTFNVNTEKVPDSFRIQAHEVSCKAFLALGVLSPLRQSQVASLCEYAMEEPVTGISFEEANGFCESKGARLPTEAQWVYGASLVSHTWLVAYGIVKGAQAYEPMASYKEDSALALLGPLGIKGLYGNVWEMTRSLWGGQQGRYIIKGGAFDMTDKPGLMHPYLRAAFLGTDIHNQNIGFRCVK